MRLSFVIGAGLLALATASAPASAVPALGGGAGVSAASNASPLIKVHGWHRVCRLGPNGWHRSYSWGRVPCVPVRFFHNRRHRY